MEGARIYAQNAIREKNQALNYLRLASRIDGVASRVEAAVRMKTVTRSMAGIVKGMDKVRPGPSFTPCPSSSHFRRRLTFARNPPPATGHEGDGPGEDHAGYGPV
jgi:hypothetical protein